MKGMMRGNGTNVIRIVPYSASQFAAYEYFRSLLMEPGKTDLDSARRLTAGAGAGVVSVACTYPLDVVRTRLSVQSASLPINHTSQSKLPGIFRTLATIYKTEGGVFGLYRGLWPTTLVRKNGATRFTSLTQFCLGRRTVRGSQFPILRVSKGLYFAGPTLFLCLAQIDLWRPGWINGTDHHLPTW